MRLSKPSRFIIVILGLAAVVSCGSRKTPEQVLSEIRQAHTIIPTRAVTITDAEGHPKMVVDLRVTNHSARPLDHLTVLVRVEDADGNERLAKRVTLDLSGTRVGVSAQVAAVIDGFDLADTDQVTVAVEGNLTPEDLRSLPEFADLPQ